MQHRHLLPNEIDLLLDGEVGFGVQPLRTHIDECLACRTRLANARVVVSALERMPHFAPTLQFADAVMAQVQVVEPLHLAAVDMVRQWVPRSAPMRAVVLVTGASVAAVVSAATVWIALRADAATFAWNMLATRVRDVVVGGTTSIVRDALGPSALAALPSAGTFTLLVGGALTAGVVSWAAFGILSRTVTSRRIRR